MGMKIFGSSSEIDQIQPTKKVERTKEIDRVLRTNGISASAINPLVMGSTSFTNVSPIPECEVVERIGQIAEKRGITPNRDGFERAIELLNEEREILEDPATPVKAEERSFLLQINQLVAEMMHLLTQLSDRERNKTDFSKKEYDVFNAKVADLTQKQGTVGAGVAILSFLISAGSALTGDFGYKIGSALAGQLQPLSGYWTSGYSAESGKYSNKMSLISNDLQATFSKNNDNSAWKNELIQSLTDIKEWLRASVRSNG